MISRDWSSSPSSFWIALSCSRRYISLLPLAQLRLDLRLDLVLRLEHADLALDQDQDAAEPVLDAEGLQQALLLVERELDVAGDEVGEPAGVGHGVQDLVEDLLGEPPLLAQLHGPLAGLAVEGGEGRVLRVDRRPSRRAATAVALRKPSEAS